MKKLLSLLIMVSSFFAAQGQTKFVNEFLNIGVGAEAHGKFGSVVATVDDVTAGYWNPAGLTQLESPLQTSVMHANWFGGIANYDYLSIAKKFSGDRSAVGGITIIRMGVDNIPNTLNLIGPDGTVNYDRITTFSASDYAVLLSYARNMNAKGNFSLGGNIKIINRSIGSFGSAWGFGADLGAQWRGDFISFGLSARDITTTFNAWSFNLKEDEKEIFQQTNNDIPVSSTEVSLPRLIAGVAIHKKKKTISYLVEADLNISSNGTEAGVFSGRNFAIDPTFGFEVGYVDRIFIRGGIGNIQSVINPTIADGIERDIEFQPNIGMGLKLGRLKVDYALTNIGSVSGVLVSHIFSLTLNFNARKSTAPVN
ncbi:MAG: PorV/PorQ family protein [Saprospiraceae bacterium]|nr:PorV/PorQ family protein [Saprospiraceae bacterium]